MIVQASLAGLVFAGLLVLNNKELEAVSPSSFNKSPSGSETSNVAPGEETIQSSLISIKLPAVPSFEPITKTTS